MPDQDAHLQGPPIREDGLQLDERRVFQRRFWVIERCAWVSFCLLLLLALAGLTGAGGYLSRGSAELQGGSVDYPAISRRGYLDTLTIRLAGPGPVRRLTLDSGFFHHFQIESLQPMPSREIAGANGTTFEFAAGSPEPVEVVLFIRSLEPGFLSYSITAAAADIRLSTAILP